MFFVSCDLQRWHYGQQQASQWLLVRLSWLENAYSHEPTFWWVILTGNVGQTDPVFWCAIRID